MDTIVFPGSFDPITLGHLDLIKRASKIAKKVVVVVVDTNNRLEVDVRVNLIKEAIKEIGLENVEVDSNDDLIVEYCRRHDYHILLRGIRNNNDYQYEQVLEINNKKLFNNLETVYMFTSPEFLHISSSVVWEVLNYQDNIDHLVPSCVSAYFKECNANL